MDKVEDRTTTLYKAQENEFYSNQWAYNTRIEEQESIINNPGSSAAEKDAARREKADLENERQDALDQWKEEHGAYNKEMTKWTIDDAVEHSKEGTGLDSMQETYDENQYGHVEEREQEEDEEIDI